jgi:hypothetical protein
MGQAGVIATQKTPIVETWTDDRGKLFRSAGLFARQTERQGCTKNKNNDANGGREGCVPEKKWV